MPSMEEAQASASAFSALIANQMRVAPLAVEYGGFRLEAIRECAPEGCTRPAYRREAGDYHAFCSRSHVVEGHAAHAPSPSLGSRVPHVPDQPQAIRAAAEVPAPALSDAHTQVMPLTAAPPLHIRRSVLRQAAWMQHQLDQRKVPSNGAKYNGCTPCPLCKETFVIGQLMVKCHIDHSDHPDSPAKLSWVHVACVNGFLKAAGRLLLKS